MKCFERISLRLRLTLLSGLVMTAVAVILTAGSIGQAGSVMVPDNYDVRIATQPAQIVAAPSSAAVSAATDDMVTASYSVSGDANGSFVVPMSQIEQFETVGEPEPSGIVSIKSAGEGESAIATYRIEAVTLTQAAQKDFATTSTWMLAGVVVCGIILTWLAAGQALKPVRALADTVAVIDAHSLSTRVSSGGAHDEIRRLTDGFNSMLDKLEDAFARQRTFAAGAAHELKTPLAAIRSNIEVLDMGGEPDLAEYQETLEVVRRNTDRLIDLVGDLLALCDEAPCQLAEAVPSAELVQEVLANVEQTALAKGLSIAVDNRLPLLYGQRPLLLSAVGNLVDNAVKYTPPGGQISLSLAQEAESAVITVQNDGPPIPEDKLAQIFEPFYRVDESRSQLTPGSGLGLALVRAIAHKYGGSITVESQAESGTCFTLTLPL